MRNIKLLFILMSCISTIAIKAQSKTITLEDLRTILPSALPTIDFLNSKFKTVENTILNEPGIYNELWSKVDNTFRQKDDQFILKNLKLDFKTFQGSDSNSASLGFGYKWNYNINKKKNEDYGNSEFIAKINAEGNIAFKKALNPLNFQSAKLEMGGNGFLGGAVDKLDTDVAAGLTKLKQKLADIDDENELANSPLWDDVTKAIARKNHYHYNFSAVSGWEGTQDFSSSQFTYGAQIRLSAKSYTDKNILSQLNILDYPFALIRYITGADKSLAPYGAAMPIVTLGIDMIDPIKDTARKNITGNEKSFARFRLEAGFRTLLMNINDAPLHFNAAYRYFKEINSVDAIKLKKLNSFSYFTFSVTSADTYFFSYSYGKLPFDRTDNAIYELGFKFNL